MEITLSVATSSDHYIDDSSQSRLILSTREDWEAVYRIRANHDAILIGGETLRRDNPSLGIKGEGREPMRIIISGHGEISPSAKIFHRGEGEIVIFSSIERDELSPLARVIVSQVIDLPLIITELEKMGVRRLLVEGGAQILNLFLSSPYPTTLRLATNPSIVVNDPSAPRFTPPKWLDKRPKVEHNLGGMEITTYTLAEEPTNDHDTELMRRAVEVSHLSPERDSCYRVGAIIETVTGEIFEGYTLETAPTHHAEQAAIHKAINAGADITGATIYSSIEPCSTRSSEKESCSQLIIRHGFAKAIFALYEPSHFVECHGAENLRRAGVEVGYMPQFKEEVLEINTHLFAPKIT